MNSKDSPAFHTTRWSIIIAAGDRADPNALGQLLATYWYPLYAYARRSGNSVHDAQDLTQAFLAHLLQCGVINSADREKGRFRSYLLGCFKNFIANQFRHHQAQKRGGSATHQSIDEAQGEQRYQSELAEATSPSDLYELSWANSLLGRVMDLLRAEYETAGRLPLFVALQPRLAGATGSESHGTIADRLQLTESAVSVSLHRMRKRYGEILRHEIADTVASPEDVDAELAHLLQLFSR